MSDASSSTPPPVVDLIDDGMTDEEIAAHTDAWRQALREEPIVDIGVNAADVLDEMYADGDL